MSTVRIETSACEAEKNKGYIVGFLTGSAIAAGLHTVLRKQVPTWAIQGTYYWQKVGGLVGLPLLGAYVTGNYFENACRDKYGGMSPPRISTTSTK